MSGEMISGIRDNYKRGSLGEFLQSKDKAQLESIHYVGRLYDLRLRCAKGLSNPY